MTTLALAAWEMPEVLKKTLKKAGDKKQEIQNKIFTEKPAAKKTGPSDSVVITLKNGNAMSGKIIREDEEEVVIFWEGGDITLKRHEIASIEGGAQIDGNSGVLLKDQNAEAAWSYENSPVVRLTNGQVLDLQVFSRDGKKVTLKQKLKEGGYLEQELPLEKIEALEFARVDNKLSREIELKLQEQYPRMKFHRLGMVTLITDSEGSALTLLKRIIREQQSVIYFEFLEALKTRKPIVQIYVVVFDRLEDYFTAAAADGVPAWACPGYFSPTQKVLYLSNYFGQEFTEVVYAVVKGAREGVGSQAQALRQATGGQRDLEIAGLEKDVNVKVQNAVSTLASVYTDMTEVTLRHELVHAFLHAWEFQSIIASKMLGDDKEEVKKKKELFDAKDLQKKKELLIEILKSKKEALTDIKIEASNSWFVEGLAEYTSTSACGMPNDQRLYELKEARRKNELWPLEQLTVFKMGSFPGVALQAALSGYAQSWSFCEFLMKNYKPQFIRYLDRMSKKAAAGNEDIQWLEEALGKKLRVVEAEWHAYIDSLPTIEDPEIDRFMRVHEILGS